MELNKFLFIFLKKSNKIVIFLLILIPFLNGCYRKSKISIDKLCDNLSIECLSGNQVIEIYTNKGKMKFELDANSAPITVSNFIDLVNNDFYNQKTFYRVIREPFNFIIQAGGSNIEKNSLQTNIKKSTNRYSSDNFIPIEIKIKGEPYPRYGKKIKDPNLLEKIQLKHKIGTLSMARSESVNSASSHFFIALKSLPVLDGRYAVFGKIVNGNAVLELINEGDFIKKIIHIKD